MRFKFVGVLWMAAECLQGIQRLTLRISFLAFVLAVFDSRWILILTAFFRYLTVRSLVPQASVWHDENRNLLTKHRPPTLLALNCSAILAED